MFRVPQAIRLRGVFADWWYQRQLPAKPGRMKFLRMRVVPAHARLISWPCRRKRHMAKLAMRLHSKRTP